MSNMRLVVIDEDSYFIDMFSSYLRTSEYGQLFSLTSFSSKDQGFEFIEYASEPYILLVHEELMPLPDKVFQQQLGCLILLSHTGSSADIVEYPVLCKYQPLHLLLSHLISHYNEYTSSQMLKGNRSTEVVSIYSAVGGSGKTITAVHLARELVLKGCKVFYLNLEQLPSISWMEPYAKDEENYLARILYYGKKDSKLQMARIERYKRKHSAMGFDYFPGGQDPKEVMDMSEQDTETLIQSLTSSAAYDYIVLDLDTCLYPRIQAALNQSDRVIWLAIDDRIHLEKSNLQLKQWKQRMPMNQPNTQKVQIVVNKFNGRLVNAAAEWPLSIAGYLPYIPEWKTFDTIEKVQTRGAFSESLAGLPWVATEGK